MVTKEVFDNWFNQSTKEVDGIIADSVYDHMKLNNPWILKYYKKLMEANVDFAAGFFACYSLMMRQEEINELEDNNVN